VPLTFLIAESKTMIPVSIVATLWTVADDPIAIAIECTLNRQSLAFSRINAKDLVFFVVALCADFLTGDAFEALSP
jgi:hypothetical protein